jgi:hypothetical protein
MSSKLKIKPKKRKLPLAQNNQAAQAFGRAMQNASSQLKEMEKKAYEDGFNTGEDWSNTINTVTTMMALRKLYGFSTKRLLDVVRTANEFVGMANEGKMSVLNMMCDIEQNTDVRFDEKNKNWLRRWEFNGDLQIKLFKTSRQGNGMLHLLRRSRVL